MTRDSVVAAYAAWMGAAVDAANGPAGFARLVKDKAAERLEAVRAKAMADGDTGLVAKVDREIEQWRRYTIPSGTRSSWRPTRTRPRPSLPSATLRPFFAAAVVELVPTHPEAPDRFPDFEVLMREYAQAQAERIGRPPSGGTAQPAETRQPTDARRLNQQLTESALGRLPDYFPDHLTVEGFAELGRVAELGDATQLGADRPGLYSDFTPYSSPEPALPVLERERRVVLLGDPGCGKSTLLQGLGIRTIRAGTGLVLFARLDDVGRIAAGADGSGPRAAASAVVTAFLNWLKYDQTAALAADLLEQLLEPDQPVVVVLDGLDEISRPEHHQGAVDVLRHLDGLDITLVVSSRITGYTRPLTSLVEHIVLPLGYGGPRNLIESWFRDERNARGKAAALNAIEDPQLADIARNQLIAGFICFVAEAERVATTKHGLYRQYLHQFLARRWKEPSAQRTVAGVDVALAAARHAAWTMATRHTPGRHPLWLDTARMGWLASASTASHEVLLDLYLTDGLLVAFGPPEDTDPMSQPVRWLHRTVHEHLVGRELAQQLLNGQPSAWEILRQALLRPTWRVPLEHCAGALAELGILDDIAEQLWSGVSCWDTLGRHRAMAVSELLRQGKSDHLVAERLELLISEGTWDLVREHSLGEIPDLLERAVAPVTQQAASNLERIASVLGGQVQEGQVSWSRAEEVEARLVSRLPGLADLWAFRRGSWRGQAPYSPGFAQWALTQLELPLADRAWIYQASPDQSLADVVIDRATHLLASVAVTDSWIRELAWMRDLIRDEDRAKIVEIAQLGGHVRSFVAAYVSSTLNGEIFDWAVVDEEDIRAVLRGDLGDHVAFESGAQLTESTGRDVTEASRWGLLGVRVAREPWHTARPMGLAPLVLPKASRLTGEISFRGWRSSIEAAEGLLEAMEQVHAHPDATAIETLLRQMFDARSDIQGVWEMDASWWQGFLAALPAHSLMDAALRLHDEFGTQQWSHIATTAVDIAYRTDPAAGLDLLSTYFEVLTSEPAERNVFRRMTFYSIADWSHDDAVEAARRALAAARETADEVWKLELTAWAEQRLYFADVLDRYLDLPRQS